MANSLSTLRSNLQQAARPGPLAAGPISNTADIGKAVTLATTGKDFSGAPSSGPARSSQLEVKANIESANQTATLQAGALDASDRVGQMQSQLEKSNQQQLTQLNEQSLNQLSDYYQKADNIAQQLSHGNLKFELTKDKANVEQIGFLTRLGNKTYIDSLKNEGAKKRLDNKKNFESATIDTYFRDMEDLLSSDISFKSALKADNRTFQAKLGEMDIESALAIASSGLSAQAKADMYSSVSAGAAGGLKAYSALPKSEAVAETSPTDGMEATELDPRYTQPTTDGMNA